MMVADGRKGLVRSDPMDDDILGASSSVVPCLRINLKMCLMFDGRCVSFDNVNLFHFLVFIVEQDKITFEFRFVY
jgi:hypothetical protein